MKKWILIGVFIVVSVPIHYYLRSNSVAYNFFFSPDDLYDNLASSGINLSVHGGAVDLQYMHKYPGNHWIAVLVEKPDRTPASYNNDFEVTLQVSNKEDVLLNRSLSDSGFWFYGGSERSGFALINYKVPRDLPANIPLVAKLVVKKASPDFQSKYGDQRLIISKFSDE
jgi:hypothetical protein